MRFVLERLQQRPDLNVFNEEARLSEADLARHLPSAYTLCRVQVRGGFRTGDTSSAWRVLYSRRFAFSRSAVVALSKVTPSL